MFTAYLHTMMIDIRKEALAILKTVATGSGQYATNTLIQILKGEVSLTSAQHSLPELGTLSGLYPRRILNLINYLIQLEFLGYSHDGSQKLQLADSGRKFLQYPSELSVSSQALRTSPYDNMLRNRLRTLRQEICETEHLPPFRIFTDYAIQRVVQDRPAQIEELELIPGFGPFKVRKYGNQILDAVKAINQIQDSHLPL